jgi:hypothetical protein
MNKAERNDILDQHRQVYDGFVTTYGQKINQQPLYVQDYANDKGGITVNNKGEVKSYTNMRINEMRYDDMDTGLFSEEHGTMDEPFMEIDEEDEYFEEDSYLDNEDIDEDMVEPLQEQVNKTLDMFKRFKKY